jgi:predicted NAD/FAD-dependent oxidoreductase
MTLDGEPLAWVSDNYVKGVAARPGAVTVCASEAFSRQMLDEPAESITQMLLQAVRPMLNSKVITTQLHRWRSSHPIRTLPTQFLEAGNFPPLVFAGDMFGAGDCESAALSGIAAATHLHSTFCPTR